MAIMRCDFLSDVLGLSTSMTVILPQAPTDQPPPVLYLLHGLSDDDTMWSRRTSIEQYATERGLAVVMPQVHRSFYADEDQGLPFWTFLTDELPRTVHRFFRLSQRREDTFVTGLSMGGYGALKWALREPWRFAAAASLSGAVSISAAHPDDPDFARLLARVFGATGISGTDNDVVHLLSTADPATLPRLYVACGTEDFLYGQNRHLLEAAERAGIPLTTSIGPGDHDWAYWDSRIRDVVDWLPLAHAS